MHRFSATIDSLSKSLTFVVLVVLIIPIITITRQAFSLNDWRLIIGPVLIIFGLLICFLFRVTAYNLDAHDLQIIRLVMPPSYAMKDIRSVETLTPKELGLGLRILGSGGFMGYFGQFYYRNYGWITCYITDRNKMLLITLANERKLIISPDDTPGFMTAFRALQKNK